MVKVLAMAGGGLVLALSLQSLYSNSLVTGVLLAILSALIVVSAVAKSKALKLPPGPVGVPVLGYLPFLGNLPHQDMAKLAKKHGPLVYLQLGSLPALLVSSPRLAREILMTQDQIFASHAPMISMQCFSYWNEKEKVRYGMASSKLGPYFRNLRRLVASELTSPKRMQLLQGMRDEEMQRMVESVFVDGQKGTVDLNSAITAMTTNVISRTVIHKRFFGKDLADETGAREFQEMMHTMLPWKGYISVADFFPSLRLVTSLLSRQQRAMARTAERVDAFLEANLQEHRGRRDGDEASQDFVDVMLNWRDEDGHRLDAKTIKTLTLELFVAGPDTSSLTIEWTVAELLRHPKILQRLQNELDTAIGTSSHVQESDLVNLPYLNAIIKETFRLHPPAPLLVPHYNSSQRTTIDGYDIPANSLVFINAWAMGRDTEIWEDPMIFNPDRFLKQSNIDVKGRHFELLAFGSGRRICPGMILGFLLVNLGVARLFHGFEMEVPDGKELDMAESFEVNLSLKEPLSCIRIRPRLSPHLYHHLH